MKKILSLVLVLIMCLSLCACGGNDAPETTEITAAEEVPAETDTSAEEPAEPENIELAIGQTYSLPTFDITITGFDFTEKATFPDGEGFSLVPQNGYITANLYYDVTYTGKTTLSSSNLSPSWLDYNDGYMFGLETFYYYDNGVEAWLNSGEIDPLTPAFSCKACFFVPEEVRDNEESPLFIDFSLHGCTFSPRSSTVD